MAFAVVEQVCHSAALREGVELDSEIKILSVSLQEAAVKVADRERVNAPEPSVREGALGAVVSRTTAFEFTGVLIFPAASFNQTDRVFASFTADAVKVLGKVPEVKVQPEASVLFSRIQ